MHNDTIPMMLALSLRSPWWWFVLHGGKDIENRDWPTKVRGRVYIHASKWFVKHEIHTDWRFCRSVAPRDISATKPAPTWEDLKAVGGHIVGTVEIVDCVRDSASPWFFGEYGFVLRDPVALTTPIPCKGSLGFFRPDIPRDLA